MPSPHGEVAIRAFRPGGGRHDAIADVVVIGGTLDGIGDGREHLVGATRLQVVDGGLEIGLVLASVAEHDEEASLDATALKQGDDLANPANVDATIHGVDDSL